MSARRFTAFGVLAIAWAGCAARPPATEPTSELATDRVEYTGWQSLDPSGPPTTDAALRAELVQRRRDLLARCDEIASDLEQRRRMMGSVPTQIVTGVAAQMASSMAQSAAISATGRPTQTPLPTGAGVNIVENVRVNTRISEIRTGMHALVVARTNEEIFDAMDRLAPKCGAR